MTRVFRMAALAATLAMALPAAVQAEAGGSVGRYFKDRGADFLDILRLRGGAPDGGKGGGVKARVTSVAQVGYVYFDGTYVGMDRRGVGVVDERRRECGLSLLYGSWNNMEPRSGNYFLRQDTDWNRLEDRRLLRNLPYWDDGRKRFLSVGAEVMTPLIGVDAGVYPEEALDFLLGFATIDIFNDDKLYGIELRNPEATTPPLPNQSAPFAERQAKFDAFRLRMAEEALEKQTPADTSREANAEGEGTLAPEKPQLQTPETPAEALPAPATSGAAGSAPGLIDAATADQALLQVEPKK